MLGLKHAIGLAKERSAKLLVLNVLDERLTMPDIDGYAIGDMTPLIESLRGACEAALKSAANVARKSGVDFRTALVASGGRFVSDVILDEAKRFRAQVVVMGTHGRRGLNRLLLGSDAERVLRDADVPVLLIRADDDSRRKRANR
jgi:nucleotide-binding universal stress UspA family protein